MLLPDEKNRRRTAWIAFAVVAGAYLTADHWGHLLAALPYAILLACPLMHVFMHHGHGGHDHPRVV